MAKRRRRKGDGKAQAAPRTALVVVELLALEIACGHDGLLRGCPEPALVIGVYRVGGGPAELVGRAERTLHPSGAFPMVMALDAADAELVRTRLDLERAQSVAILAIALERDGGRDLTAVYAAMTEAATIRLWDRASTVPAPMPIGEMALRESAPGVQVVQAILGESDLSAACTDDELVGACMAVRARPTDEDVRLRFVTDDGRNDWTAVLHVKVR